MTLRYLLDTSTISEMLRPLPNPAAQAKIQEHVREIAIASLVWHELVFGCCRLAPSRRRARFEQFLFEVIRPTVPILSYDDAAGEWHARERARRFQQPPPFVDGQIAAVARTHDLVLVTANISDFAGFEGLRIENWII